MSLTGDALFIGSLLLGCFLIVYSHRRRQILVSMTTFMVWFGLSMWLFFSTSAPIGFGETWQDVLAWAFFILSILPFMFALDQEIVHEAEGKRWTRYGEPPEEQGPSEYEAYRDTLYNRTRRGRR